MTNDDVLMGLIPEISKFYTGEGVEYTGNVVFKTWDGSDNTTYLSAFTPNGERIHFGECWISNDGLHFELQKPIFCEDGVYFN